MDLDQILSQLGGVGRFQKLCIVLLWLPPMFAGIHNLLFVFTGLKPKRYRCKIPECDGDNFNFNDFPSELFPLNEDGNYDFCRYYQPLVNISNGLCSQNAFDETRIISCPQDSQFAFESFEFEETLVTELNSVCGKQPTLSTVQCSYIIGLLVGSSVSGLLSDRIGRRPALAISILLSSVSELLGSFTNSVYGVYFYAVTRFLAGLGHPGMYNIAFSLTIELIDKGCKVPYLSWISISSILGIFSSLSLSLGMMILSLLAPAFKSWQTLQLAVSSASFLQFLIYMIIPESPRWLISVGNIQQAEKVLKKIASMNKMQDFAENFKITPEVVKENEVQSEVLGFKDLFNRRIILFTIVQLLIWPAVTLGYFGLSYGSSQMEGNFFLNNIFLTAVDFPGFIYIILLMDIWGRKPLMLFSLLFTGASTISSAFFSEKMARNCLLYAAKNTAAGAYALAFVYTSELFPTSLRSTGIGTCYMMSGLGTMVAPLMSDIGKATFQQLPYFLLGGLTLLGGLLVLLLPETLGSKLPENLEDIEKLKKNSKSIFICIKPTKKEESS